ncbi:RNA polymerase sigma-70 factor (ECF subfamily) [Motilibacter rhizosphaerae]|uniref:RNA polymerase sigma-70 factor (ECF subfamily) n=1 Tax=Motilibacter rhizosphaerae TaxID=598652 RepID=A0A4Q7NRP9_9ACTN|nr:SigE family RNA polymerase sigma factor [Motilibacter rhizosphaerae]RZS87320.1 RNA polymerase sigma-70 factor (ECF subfamily) [Motilibacter rhizosphaerae]
MTEDEFSQLYAASQPRLVRAVYAVTGDLGEAQDVVSETFVRAWTKRRTLGDVDAPEAWLRTVALRLAVSRWRRARTSAAAWRRHGPPPDVPGLSPDSVALVAALQRLPDAQRVVTVLHYLYDLPLEQIAVETSTSLGSVKSRLFRARSALAPLLDDSLHDPTPEEPRVRTAPR